MSKIISLIGERQGLLRVVDFLEPEMDGSGQLRTYWLCQCTCGELVRVKAKYLRRSSSKSCKAAACRMEYQKRSQKGTLNEIKYPIYEKTGVVKVQKEERSMKNSEIKFIKGVRDLSIWVQNFDDKRKVIAIDGKMGFRATVWVVNSTIEAAVSSLITDYTLFRAFKCSNVQAS